MGWIGIIVLGVAVGWAGWWLYPPRVRGRGALALAVAAGLAGAALARFAGGATGAFADGDVLEWPACTAAALLAVTLMLGLRSRP
ncbi:hypothetical protein CY652_16495 [Burkholderia sp. WAC0059]|nr:hypothetical protein [Burkholderia sp. WAC0059]PLZ01425.1 hypothetical protein CY652_16495 [Burkholderia sp. WAC0059]